MGLKLCHVGQASQVLEPPGIQLSENPISLSLLLTFYVGSGDLNLSPSHS